MIGCLELEKLTEYTIVSTTTTIGNYTYESTSPAPNALGKLKVYNNYMIYALLAIRIIMLVLIIIFGAAIVHKLRKRGRQVAGMMSASQAKQKHQEMVTLCRFQIIDTIVMALTVLVINVHKFDLDRFFQLGHARQTFFSYSYAMQNFYALAVTNSGKCGTMVFQSFAQGELFLIYLISFKKFRVSVVTVLRTFLHKGSLFC